MSRPSHPMYDRAIRSDQSTMEAVMSETIRTASRPQGAHPETFRAERVPLGDGVYGFRYIESGTVDRSQQSSAFPTEQNYEIQVSGSIRPQEYPSDLPEERRDFAAHRSNRDERPSRRGDGQGYDSAERFGYPNVEREERRHFEPSRSSLPYDLPSRNYDTQGYGAAERFGYAHNERRERRRSEYYEDQGTSAHRYNTQPRHGSPSRKDWYPNIEREERYQPGRPISQVTPPRYSAPTSRYDAQPHHASHSREDWYPDTVPISPSGAPRIPVPAQNENRATWRDQL